MATHSSILVGEFHGQRSVVGYKSMGSRRVGRGHKESDMAESHTHTHTHTHTFYSCAYSTLFKNCKFLEGFYE